MKKFLSSGPSPRLSVARTPRLPVALALGILVLSLLAASCNNGSPDSVKEAKADNAKNTDSMQAKASVTDSAVTTKQDAAYMVDAVGGGMMEVELGKLAQANAGSEAVKDFGTMMVTDHGKGGDELRSLALAKAVTLPDSISNDQKKKREDLAKMKGKAFDKAYIDYMVDDHKEDISEFEKAAKNANDPDIKAWFNNHIPVLRHHLEVAQTLQQRRKR